MEDHSTNAGGAQAAQACLTGRHGNDPVSCPTAPVNWLTQQLWQMPAPDLLVHIGAGECSELEDYRLIRPRRVVLVEPDPDRVAGLRLGRQARVEVLPVAVAADEGRVALHQYNLADLDGLRPLADLRDRLPGLRETGRIEVDAISAAMLARQLPWAENGRHWLVVEASGVEKEVLRALAECGALQRFQHLIVRLPRAQIYGDTAEAVDAVLEELAQAGYAQEGAVDDADGDWPRYHLKHQPMALRCRQLEAELAAVRRQAERREDCYRRELARFESHLQLMSELVLDKQ